MTPIQQMLLGAGGASEAEPWAHVIGNANDNDYPGQIVLDSSRNIIFTIVRTGELRLMKLSNDGTILWGRRLNMGVSYSTGLDKSDVVVDSSNNIYVAVTTDSNYSPVASSIKNEGNILVLKYNSSGVIQWQREIGTSYSSGPNGNLGGIAVDSSDNVYVTGTQIGYSQSSTAFQKYILVKFNSSGTHQWTERLQGYYTSNVTAQNRNAISQYHRSNGITFVPAASGQPEGVCICGRQMNYDSQSSSADFFIARYDTSGNIQWRKCYGRSVYNTKKSEGPTYGYDAEAMKPITTDSSGNIIVIGSCNNEQQFDSSTPDSQMLFKLDPSGSVSWSKRFGQFYDRGKSLTVTNSGDIIAVGGRYLYWSYLAQGAGCINFYTSSGTPKRSFNLSSGGSGTYSDYNRLNYAQSVAADNKDFFYLLAGYKSVTASSGTSNTNVQIVVFKLRSADFTTNQSSHPSLAGYNGSMFAEPNRWGIRDRGPSSTYVANPSYQYINLSGGISAFDQSTGGYPSGARMTDSVSSVGTLPINTTTLTDQAATATISHNLISDWPTAAQ